MMSYAEVFGLITQVIILITALAGLWRGVRNADHLHKIHLELNSRLTELIVASKAEGHGAGVAEERVRTEKMG